MSSSFLLPFSSTAIGLVLFALFVLLYLAGFYLREYLLNKKDTRESLGSMGAALLGLLALLLGFTFSMANERYDERREAIVNEANAIGTAYLRTSVYPDSIEQLLQAQMKDYVEARIAYFEVGANIEGALKHYNESVRIGNEIWQIASDHAEVNTSVVIASQLLPALNEMLDSASTRLAVTKARVPEYILDFLILLTMLTCFYVGYEGRKRMDWIALIGFTFMLALTIKTIIDLDRPRRGAITLKEANEQIVELRDLFK